MNAHSEALKKKIVEGLGRGMCKCEATCISSVNLSSVKRYARMAEEDHSPAPKKRPSSKPKLGERARRLLEEDLKERPFITLKEAITLCAAFC